MDGTKRRKSRSNFFFIFFQFPLRGVIFAGFGALPVGPWSNTHHPAENSLKRLPLLRKLPRICSSEHSAILCLNARQRQYKGYFRGGNRSSQIWLGPRKVVDACRTASISRNSAYVHRRRDTRGFRRSGCERKRQDGILRGMLGVVRGTKLLGIWSKPPLMQRLGNTEAMCSRDITNQASLATRTDQAPRIFTQRGSP